MSKKRITVRERRKIEDIVKEMSQAEAMPLISVLQLPNGELTGFNMPMKEEEEMLAVYFIVRNCAEFHGMTTEEYIFKMMRKFDEGSKARVEEKF